MKPNSKKNQDKPTLQVTPKKLPILQVLLSKKANTVNPYTPGVGIAMSPIKKALNKMKLS